MKILLIDDDRDDQDFFREAVARISPSVIFDVADDGQHGLDRLNSSEELPQLIVLDINMPRLNGWDTLKAIRATPRLKEIDVVICSTSSANTDRDKSYKFGARFIPKANSLTQIILSISDLILETIESAKVKEPGTLAFEMNNPIARAS